MTQWCVVLTSADGSSSAFGPFRSVTKSEEVADELEVIFLEEISRGETTVQQLILETYESGVSA